MVTIITNNKPRDILYWSELTSKERSELAHYDASDNVFIRYRGEVYDLSEFMSVHGITAFAEWHGYMTDTYFSGIVMKYVENNHGEGVIVGRFYS